MAKSKKKHSKRQTGQEKLSKIEEKDKLSEEEKQDIKTKEEVEEWARNVISEGYRREDILNLLNNENREEIEKNYILNIYDNELIRFKEKELEKELAEERLEKELAEERLEKELEKERLEKIKSNKQEKGEATEGGKKIISKTTPDKEEVIIIEEENVKKMLKKGEEERKKKELRKRMEKEKKMEKERMEKLKEKEKIKAETKNKQTKLEKTLIEHNNQIKLLKKEIGKSVIGQKKIINGIIRGFLADGHVLIEGVPGIAKTLLIKTLAKASGCEFSRIQFTVDLLPTDITGVTTYDESKKEFSTFKGPIFANFVIADEINRAPPKSQSAMLEAMQEKQVTIGKNTHKLPSPFFVMANNNPLESSGTYPLPEAQVDRFLFKLKMEYTSTEDEEKIIDTNMTIKKFEDFNINSIISPKKILEMQETVKKITSSPEIKKYIIKIIDATRNPKKYNIRLGKYIEWGCSPRASIGLNIAAKTDALLHGTTYITPQNIKNIAHDVLRHRLILNYSGQAEKVKSEDIIDEILKKVPLP